MTKRDELMGMLAELPDADIEALWGVAQRLRVTMAPPEFDLGTIMDAAPEDDEPSTPEEEAAVKAALEDVAAGRVHTADQVRRMLAG